MTVRRNEGYWDLVVESCARDDRDLNFNAEFLPAPYADADAHDGVRTADVLNEWMMRHLRRVRAERWTQE